MFDVRFCCRPAYKIAETKHTDPILWALNKKKQLKIRVKQTNQKYKSVEMFTCNTGLVIFGRGEIRTDLINSVQ